VRKGNRLAIFDLDGTLVDSVLQIGTILNRSRELLGHLALSMSFYEESIGLPLEFLIADLQIPSEQKTILISTFRAELMRDISAGNNLLFEGVTGGLGFLNAQGIHLAIATSKPTHIALEVYKSSGLNQFPIYIQGTDGFPAKPNPDVINYVLKAHPYMKAIMIGDRIEDMTAAKSASIPAIGIAASAHSEDMLLKAGAVQSFASFKLFSHEISTNNDFLTQIFD
jgi:phosphoglycolate phosphatase